MDMPQVKSCAVNVCFYNENNECHANAITVGSPCPKCDTFIATGQHAEPADVGKVGACHESDCRYNSELSCNAPGIDVGFHMSHADCQTYTPMK